MRTYPPAKGSISRFGYRRITCKDRKQRFEHVLVWERHYGPVPPGMELHHINGNKLDNRIENLMPVTRLDHKRIHSGCYRKNGRWFKKCKRCRWYREVDSEFYVYPGKSGASAYCRRCMSDLAVANKRRRRAARRAVSETTPAIAEVVSGEAG